MPPSTVSAKLGVAPLLRCRAKTTDLIQTTEAERLVGERIGQQIFRDALLEYGRPPPDHQHHRSRPAARLPPRAVGRMRGRAAARRARHGPIPLLGGVFPLLHAK